MQVVERAPVLVAHFLCYLDWGPAHMLWVFPAPIGSDPRRHTYKYYSFERESSEIENSLTEDILQAHFGRSDTRFPPTTRQRM